MRIKILISLALLAGGAAASGLPVPAGDPVEGLRVATRVGCNGCHGLDDADEPHTIFSADR